MSERTQDVVWSVASFVLIILAWDLVVRGGYGLFYPRIPSIYTSAVEVENGMNRSHLLLDNTDFSQRLNMRS